MKKSLASVEIAAIIHELQRLVKGKVSQIYDYGEKELLLQVHAPQLGKQLLRIIPGKLLNLTDKKETSLRPTGFCMQLRKYIDNATINKIEQQNSERIVIIELEKKERFYLIIEFFSTGNIILTDNTLNIIGVLHRQIWKDRAVKPRETYVFPEHKAQWKDISSQDLEELLNKSEKKNIATALATEVSLGGVYAEEICKQTQVDKNKLPTELSREEVQKLAGGMKALLKLIANPHGYIYEQEISPFPLSDAIPIKKMETYNEAINTLNPLEVASPFEKKISGIKKMITEQEESIKELQEKIDRNKRKGELIYEHYPALQKLLQIVQELRKSHDWNFIEKELKKEKRIRQVNLKDKKIRIDL